MCFGWTMVQPRRCIRGHAELKVRITGGFDEIVGGGNFVILTRLGVILPLVVPQTGALATFL
mgnify:CR=1 FL=1